VNKKIYLLALPVFVMVVGSWLRMERAAKQRFITYRGERIKLSRAYDDFETYKNDPGNIDLSETARVQQLVKAAPVAQSFPDRLSLFRGTQPIVFPGYGNGSGEGVAHDGNELLAVTIEIPRSNQDRYLLFTARQRQYQLLDDFVQAAATYPFGVREEHGFYIYQSAAGKELFRRAVSP
jgi:hypothetical protein